MSKQQLERLSKSDLIYVINQLLADACPTQKDYYLARALHGLRYEKELAKITRADEYGREADEKRRESISLLAQYDGWKYIDIPLEVLEKARRLMDEAAEAERMFAKLVGCRRGT